MRVSRNAGWIWQQHDAPSAKVLVLVEGGKSANIYLVDRDNMALREQSIGESDDWVESLNYRIRTETDAEMAYRLLKDFAVIPSPESNAPPENRNDSQAIDPQTMARAKELAIDALRRGSTVGTETAELEKLAPGQPATSF